MDVADTKTNAKTKTQTNKKCLCYIFEEQGVLGEDVRTVDVDMVDMVDMDMVDMDKHTVIFVSFILGLQVG